MEANNLWDHGQVRMGDRLGKLRGQILYEVLWLDRAFAPYYLLVAAVGTLCFVVQLTLNTGWMRLIALGWVVIVPLWIQRYRQHRNARRGR
ncbi:hypothetical protein [Dactylosporangium sp. NPDC005555]|uniref:hypothetical protein n=1 Tax=Dactylosporangium sp. NPDC005555 TaxID=3154889 RepID=UPI0033A953EE